MPCSGWRTLVAEKPSSFTLSDNCINIDGNTADAFPLNQIKNLVILSPYGSISLQLLSELNRNNINVLICDKTRTPAYEMVNIGDQSNIASAVMNQAKWDSDRKAVVWQHLVRNKIRMQKSLLLWLGKEVPEKMQEYYENVLPDDPTNREGQAARVYFPALFGPGFRRMAPDAVNSGLNYGYTILRTSLDRIITAYGYHTALGIHHCSEANRFNLSCDIIEPFRPFVDEVVCSMGERELDTEYKELLIGIMKVKCAYKGMEYSIEQAMDAYTCDIIEYLNKGEWKIGEVSLQ